MDTLLVEQLEDHAKKTRWVIDNMASTTSWPCAG